LFAVLLLLAGACSGEQDPEGGSAPPEKTSREESTRSSPATVREETEDTAPPEATLGSDPEPPGVVLRIEGSRKTTFSGICAAGGEENVLSGKVPKRFTFDLPEGRKLSCRIEKQDSGRGELKVILTSNGTTRSVQQTTSSGGVINVSYQGG
jgi:hypothetical protein